MDDDIFNKLAELIDNKQYRLRQFEHAIYRELISNTDEITVFPLSLRNQIRELNIWNLTLIKLEKSADHRTQKALFQTDDKQVIESVLMKHQGRNTVCVSSQIGCPCKCAFCATGKLGFKRNLTYWEILQQVLFWNRQLKNEFMNNGAGEWKTKSPPPLSRVRNVVFMGMGEPLLNSAEVLKAIEILNDDTKFGIGQRKITISTVGIVPEIIKLAQKKMQVNLALSLHAPNDLLRNSLLPINLKYSLKELMPSVWHFADKTKRRIFIEYTVIKNINDSDKVIMELGTLLKGHSVHINLIPLNENDQIPDFQKPDLVDLKNIQEILLNKFDLISTIRQEFGNDISGACGQLAGQQ